MALDKHANDPTVAQIGALFFLIIKQRRGLASYALRSVNELAH